MVTQKIWSEKYRPTNLKDYIFQNDTLEETVREMLSNGFIPHLLFSGVQGSGKSTLSFIIVKELGVDPTDVLTLNASDENSVDTVRDKIKNFISTHSFGEFKIVQLEEADYITPAAQAALRSFMEEYSDYARFILTCNYKHKIIPAIRSRCQEFHFEKPKMQHVLQNMYHILKKESIKTNLETLEFYVNAGYPDIRKIINLLQQNSTTGTLVKTEADATSDYKLELMGLIGDDKWSDARKLCCDQVSNEEWEDVYKFIYENLHTSGKFKNPTKWEEGIIVIAEHLYKHTLVAVPEINGAAMFIKLSHI